MFWFTYILRCADNSYYVGITNDLQKRLQLHNSGEGSKYVRSRLPANIAFSEQYLNKSEARKREIQLKGWSRMKKEKLINNKIHK